MALKPDDKAFLIFIGMIMVFIVVMTIVFKTIK